MTKEGVAPLDELSLINRFLFKSADITEVLSQLVITQSPHLSLSSQVKVPITFSSSKLLRVVSSTRLFHERLERAKVHAVAVQLKDKLGIVALRTSRF